MFVRRRVRYTQWPRDSLVRDSGRVPPGGSLLQHLWGGRRGDWYGTREGREGARAKLCRLVKCSCRSGLQFVLLPLVTHQVLAPLRQFEDPEISTRRRLPPLLVLLSGSLNPIIIRSLSFPAAITPLSPPSAVADSALALYEAVYINIGPESTAIISHCLILRPGRCSHPLSRA